MPQTYDYISLLVSFPELPEGLGSLFQWIAMIGDRFELSLLNELFKEEQNLCLFTGWPQTCEGNLTFCCR